MHGTVSIRDRIIAATARADDLSIAFVGETIIDEYRYVSCIGKPSKEPALATVAHGSEEFLGGARAAARHGEWKGARVLAEPAEPIRKTRFVDRDFNRKLFEVYSARSVALGETERHALRNALHEAVHVADAVIVLDFGHGLLGRWEREILGGAKFLAVNAQTNAGNFGFNPVTRYKRADYVCVDDPEARLATGMAEEPIEGVIVELYARIACRYLTVTHGRHGAISYDGESFHRVSARTARGIDTMGAGDAFLAVAGPLLAAGLDLPAATAAGNAAGALKVEIVGHRSHVTRAQLLDALP